MFNDKPIHFLKIQQLANLLLRELTEAGVSQQNLGFDVLSDIMFKCTRFIFSHHCSKKQQNIRTTTTQRKNTVLTYAHLHTVQKYRFN